MVELAQRIGADEKTVRSAVDAYFERMQQTVRFGVLKHLGLQPISWRDGLLVAAVDVDHGRLLELLDGPGSPTVAGFIASMVKPEVTTTVTLGVDDPALRDVVATGLPHAHVQARPLIGSVAGLEGLAQALNACPARWRLQEIRQWLLFPPKLPALPIRGAGCSLSRVLQLCAQKAGGSIPLRPLVLAELRGAMAARGLQPPSESMRAIDRPKHLQGWRVQLPRRLGGSSTISRRASMAAWSRR
jgi:hypothetical protein